MRRLDNSVAGLQADISEIKAALAAIAVKLDHASGNSVGDRIMDAIIHWGVPAVIAGLVWLLAASGQVRVPQSAAYESRPDCQPTQAAPRTYRRQPTQAGDE